MITLWSIRKRYFALTAQCQRCLQTNIEMYILESNKKKRKIVCEDCLKHYPIAGKKAPIKFTKNKKYIPNDKSKWKRCRTIEVSLCCSARVEVKGKTTYHYVCSKCRKVCDTQYVNIRICA